MSDWDEILSSRQSKYPDTNIVRWVMWNYGDLPHPSEVRFLDIGSGRHAPITRFLENEGFDATAIDVSYLSLAHHHEDIREVEFDAETFDCIIDCNTLCHIENPPMESIKSWLKPGGKFLSVAPAAFTSIYVDLKRRGYCRFFTAKEAAAFGELIGPTNRANLEYPDRDWQPVMSWMIEATKDVA